MEKTLHYTVDTCKAVIDHIGAKCAGAISILIASYSFSGVRYTVLIAIGMLVIIDYITAILAEIAVSYAKSKKKTFIQRAIDSVKNISSRRSFKTVVKALVYALMVATGSFTEIVIGVDNIPITEIIASLIAVTEAISILENVGKAGYVVPKKLMTKLKELKEEK